MNNPILKTVSTTASKTALATASEILCNGGKKSYQQYLKNIIANSPIGLIGQIGDVKVIKKDGKLLLKTDLWYYNVAEMQRYETSLTVILP